VPGPIDIIVSARRRIARNAAIDGFLYSVLPAIAAFALAFAVRPLSLAIEARHGYQLTPERAALLCDFLIFVGCAALIVGGIRAWRAWQRADDFVAAAQEVDGRVGAHEEIVTLATLADPALDPKSRQPRSALFPLLWQRATKFLEGFDPNREFPLRVGEPLKRSSIFAGLFAGVMILAMLGLVRPPSPMQAEAARLRRIADDIARTASTPDDNALAEKVRDAADALDNPSLPPEQKQQKLAAVRAEMEQRSESAKQQRSEVGTGKGSSGKGSGEGRAEQQANSGGSSSQGEGKGQGGSGSESSNNEGSGAGKGSGSKQNGQNKDSGTKNKDQNNIKLQNELARAEAQVQTAGAQNPGSGNEPGTDKNQPGPKAGNNPNEKGPGANPNQPGNVPKPGTAGDKNMPSGNDASGKDMGSNQGDTHLGEFPNPEKTQRYLKPGEGGGVNISDARYVTFKIPGAPSANSAGRAVLDKSRPTASTPYVNAPLAQTRDNTMPDEQQLVPPRYRDLIH
jgi:hypothetical protein